MKKIRIVSLISSAFAVLALIPRYPVCYAESAGIDAEYRTPAEIKEYFENHTFEMYSSNTFDVQPNKKAPYNIGSLDDYSLQNGLDALNFIRYTAGLSEVTLNDEYNELCQAAALVNCVNNELSHFPEQPAGMTDELYSKAYQGASSSNIAYDSAEGNLAYITAMLYMNDSDPGNISRVGHRRWCLNPEMGATGFGSAGIYSAMYSIDRSNSNVSATRVCWPAQNMPLEYFEESDFSPFFYSSPAWSVSTGHALSAEDVKVTIIRKYDSRQWQFSTSSSDGDFYVSNDYCGSPGCIIFKPDDISYSSGDSFEVKITGTPEDIEYTVNFFSMDDVYAETGDLAFGDLNYDRRVDASDSSSVLVEYSLLSTGRAGNFNGEQNKSADVNSDGKIDASDASTILVYYSYASTSLSPLGMAGWLKEQAV